MVVLNRKQQRKFHFEKRMIRDQFHRNRKVSWSKSQTMRFVFCTLLSVTRVCHIYRFVIMIQRSRQCGLTNYRGTLKILFANCIKFSYLKFRKQHNIFIFISSNFKCTQIVSRNDVVWNDFQFKERKHQFAYEIHFDQIQNVHIQPAPYVNVMMKMICSPIIRPAFKVKIMRHMLAGALIKIIVVFFSHWQRAFIRTQIPMLFTHSIRMNHINGIDFDKARWLLTRCKQRSGLFPKVQTSV